MKHICDYITEGYWGCEPFENDYVLDKQSDLYSNFYNKVLSNVKYNKDGHDLYFDVAIAIDFFERMHGCECSRKYEENKQTKELLLKCLDKVYDSYYGEWNNSTEGLWKSTIDKLRKKVNKIFK